ncbi:hypothetical protein C8Q80DRAFT_1141645 [Daedaleopsis nitida]|nr:hypothetical protein C8Q80DRAFT_1141645 [Daedaleopsis nitida]
MIYDRNTHTAVSESATIAQYLDRTYPSTPELLPKETIVYRTYAQQNPRTAERFRCKHEAQSQGRLEELPQTGSEKWRKHWENVEDALHMFKEWIEADGVPGMVLFISAGGRISYADITIASWLAWLRRVCGENSQE